MLSSLVIDSHKLKATQGIIMNTAEHKINGYYSYI